MSSLNDIRDFVQWKRERKLEDAGKLERHTLSAIERDKCMELFAMSNGIYDVHESCWDHLR